MFGFSVSEPDKKPSRNKKPTKEHMIHGTIRSKDKVYLNKLQSIFEIAPESKSIKGSRIAVVHTNSTIYQIGTVLIKEKGEYHLIDNSNMYPYSIGDEVKGVLNNKKEFIIYGRKGKFK